SGSVVPGGQWCEDREDAWQRQHDRDDQGRDERPPASTLRPECAPTGGEVFVPHAVTVRGVELESHWSNGVEGALTPVEKRRGAGFPAPRWDCVLVAARAAVATAAPAAAAVAAAGTILFRRPRRGILRPLDQLLRLDHLA